MRNWGIALVVGGARSGKSAFAEKLVSSTGQPRHYLATAEAWDDEMRLRIAQHRAGRGEEWLTVETPLDLVGALDKVPETAAVLVDCATLWLTNHLLAGHDLETETGALIAALDRCRAPVAGTMPQPTSFDTTATALGRQFRDVQGRLNQRIAARADLVVGVMAGLPFVLKGALPEGLA
jgi:adenosylcobinamide kinase / adenosylcobinamide-phosphate guanylyltransferase